MTLQEWRIEALEKLNKVYDIDEARAIIKILLEEVTQLDAAGQSLQRSMILTEEVQTQLSQYLALLLKEHPLQYVLGYAWFYGMKLKVNRQVLIPRRETEELVEWVINSLSDKFVSILDIGTGSGCIALALKQQLPDAEITGWDVSSEALKTSALNAEMNKLHVKLEQKDILEKQSFSHKWNVIVSNPPYVMDSEKKTMREHVLAHEPAKALFVEDTNSLVFYEAIGKFSWQHLLPEGLLFFEINESKGPEVVSLLEDIGFKDVRLKKDMQGKDRMVCAKKRLS